MKVNKYSEKFLINLAFKLVLGSIVLAALLVQACTNASNSKPAPPKYRFGDRVYVPDGFYQGAKGRVIRVYSVNNEEWQCKLDVTYVSVDGKFSKNETGALFKCSDLLEDASE